MVKLTLVVMSLFGMYPKTTHLYFDSMEECEQYKTHIEEEYSEKLKTFTVHCDEN